MTARVGFCCKYLHPDQTQPKKILMEIQQQRTERSTTVAWLDRQTVDIAEERLYDIMQHNMQIILHSIGSNKTIFEFCYMCVINYWALPNMMILVSEILVTLI